MGSPPVLGTRAVDHSVWLQLREDVAFWMPNIRPQPHLCRISEMSENSSDAFSMFCLVLFGNVLTGTVKMSEFQPAESCSGALSQILQFRRVGSNTHWLCVSNWRAHTVLMWRSWERLSPSCLRKFKVFVAVSLDVYTVLQRVWHKTFWLSCASSLGGR